jgi:asparagine synthase (glutamine-hydrolysing)
MCGIAGISYPSSNSNTDYLLLGKMRSSLIHRGPDDSGEWWSADHSVGLSHQRLSILDLSSAGHQPMLDPMGSLCITFNGEIYNHNELRDELRALGYIFRSTTDTEVIIFGYKQWGKDFLKKMNGMFAFAIYDIPKKQIFIARDRVGEKPLFYTLGKGIFKFASELKALMADSSMPRKLNLESLDSYLAMGFVPGSMCILEGVYKLPPAHALLFSIDSREVTTWRYWDLPESPVNKKISEGQEEILLDDLETLLESSVQMQLAADVPVGVLLSGGVDSSLITALASRSGLNVNTFTIRFPGYAGYDESGHARLIAEHFGTRHIELDAAETASDLLPLLARQYDEPIVDSSMIPTFLVSRLIREHCKVALGGDGGDELFGGYAHYSRLLWTESKVKYIPQMITSRVTRVAESILPVGFRGKVWLQGLSTNWKTGLPLIAAYFDPDMRRRLMKKHFNWNPSAENLRNSRIPHSPDILQRAMRMDFENYLPEDILVKVDRASMLNSLEIRAPFLDHRVIEFAFGRVPSYLKANIHEKKILLKRLTGRLLPAQFDKTRKQGFAIPLSEWLRSGSFRALFYDVLLDRNCIFDKEVVQELLKTQEMGMHNSERLFALVMFELWRREYNISL